MNAAVSTNRLVLAESGKLRLISFFVLYFGQGLPIGLANVALPAWLAANGAPESAVAAIIATGYLPWSFKWIPAALMDRYSYLPMGRRRLWLILALALMMAGFLIAALAAPGVRDIQLLIALAFLLGAASAVQDVAVDGLAVDILPDREQGPASSFMFGGQVAGTAFSGAAAGYLLFTFGSGVTFLAYLPVIACLMVFAIVLRERVGEKRLPWTAGSASPVNLERQVGAWLPMIGVTLRSLIKRDSVVLIASSAAQRTAGGILTTMFPILATTFLAFNEASYSATVSGIDLGVALAGIALGSLLTLRLGPKWSAILVCVAMALLALFIMAGREWWLVTGVFIALYTLFSLGSLLASITTNPLRMQLSDPRVAATQFTIYNSLSNLPVSLGAMLFAALGGTAALASTMLVTAGLFAAAAVILVFIRVGGAPAKAEPAPRMD